MNHGKKFLVKYQLNFAPQLLQILEHLFVLKPTRIILDQGEVGEGTLIVENVSYWRRLLDSAKDR